MIKSISTMIASGEKLVIPLKNDTGFGYTIVNIDGLGPPDAVINTLGGPTFDGETVNSTKVGKRTITLTLAVLGGGTSEEEARKALYKWFPIKKPITLEVETSTRLAEIVAYTESNRMNMFSPIENAVLTFNCPSAYFKSVGGGDFNFFGTTPVFEFPFSNESLVAPLIIMGEGLASVEEIIDYTGDAPTGVVFTISALGPATNIGIFNNSYNESITIDTDEVATITGGPIALGDDIILDTRVGSKSATLIRSGISYNIINALELFTKWISFYPGDNDIVITADTGVTNLRMSVSYDILYEGV